MRSPWTAVAGKVASLVGLGVGLGLFSACSQEVEEAPPAPQADVVSAAPGPDYVWIGGYWGHGWGHYHWVGGHWDRPPHAHAAWVAPRWESRGRAHVFVKGYWR